MSGEAVRVGFFGKLPARGDFIRMGISRATAEAWDRWVTSVIPQAEPELHGLADAGSSPSWRFAFDPGVCGPYAVGGLWLPSSDRVGRVFPLLIAAESADVTEEFLDAVEVIGTTAIREAMTPETLLCHLLGAPRLNPASHHGGAAIRWWRSGSDAAAVEADTLPDEDAFIQMLRA